MQLMPVLHPLPGESLVSWCGRLAGIHAGTSVQVFLKMIAVSRDDIVKASDRCLDRLTSLTGVARSVLEEGAYRSVGDREFVHRTERFGFEFALRNWTTFCPACLLEDLALGSPSSGQRVGRVNWLFAPIRTCPVHIVALVRRANTHYSEQFQDMSLVAPDQATLALQAEVAMSRGVSPLQNYVERRFDGAAGPTWLDGQVIDQATRSCEMLGACLSYGAHCNLEALTIDQRDEAGAVGFEAAAAGPDGVLTALEKIDRNSRETWTSGAGPQARLGRIYQWLQFNKSLRDPGPIRDLVRAYILDTMAIGAGTNLFGQVVDARLRHSVASLAKSERVHPTTLNRALIRSGIMMAVEQDRIDSYGSFDATAGEALTARIKLSLPVIKIPQFLNCNRTQAQSLVKAGLLQPLVPNAGKFDGVLRNVAIDDLTEFLQLFRGCGRGVAAASNGMCDVIAASEIARAPVIDIVRMVLDRALAKVEVIATETKFKSVLVDPEEVRTVVAARGSDKGLALADVAKRLGIPNSGVNHLRRNIDASGRAFLKAIPVVNGRGSIQYRYAPDEVSRFADLHAKLGDIARERGLSSKAMSKVLSENGTGPILNRIRLEAAYYRRADI